MTVGSLSLLLCVVAVLVVGDAPMLYLVSDVHFDPLFGTAGAVGRCTSDEFPYGTTSCDTSLPLLRSAMEDLATQFETNGDGVVIFAGDFVRHFIPPDDAMAIVLNATATLVAELSRALEMKRRPAGKFRRVAHFAPLLPMRTLQAVGVAIGNNDNSPDFAFDVNRSSHPALDQITDAMESSGWFTSNDTEAIRKCGFYAHDVEGWNLRLVTINTVIYSMKHFPSPLQEEDPCGQLQWLSQVLRDARVRGRRVMIIGHITPTPSRWMPTYMTAYRDVIKGYTDVIAVQWFSHTHMSEFIVLDGSNASMPLVVNVPSISPRDGNNPSYLGVTFDDQNTTIDVNQSQWRPLAIHQRTFQGGGRWGKGGTFPNDYPTAPPSLRSDLVYAYLTSLLSVDKTNPAWVAFETYYFGGVVNAPLGNTDKTKALCDMTTYSPSDYDACKNKYRG